MTNLLIYRWLLANAAIAAPLSIPLMRGDITRLLNEDSSYLSHAILALFAVAWVWNAREIFRMSARRNAIARVRREYRQAAPGEAEKAMAKLQWLFVVPSWLVGLGLLGTVWGFKVALGAVDQGSLANANGVQSSIGILTNGVTIAIITTLCGGAAGLWLDVCNCMLKTAATCYWADRQ